MIAPKEDTKKTLYTIGYEGLDLEHFIRFLKADHIDVLVDVREIPLSRKKGFSKSRLSDALTSEGIQYEHIKALGSPSPIRKKLKADWNYDAFFKAYNHYLDDHKEALDLLSDIVEMHGNVCLMCFEKTQDICHRRSIADRTAKRFRGRLDVQPVNTYVK